MKKILTWVLIIVLVIIAGVIISIDKRAPSSDEVSEVERVRIAGALVSVQVASTISAWAQGLGGQESLGEDEGMLFVFDTPARRSFYMKDMNFPIDIIWLDENMQVVYIKENAEPDSYPEETFTPDQKAKYVLEVNAGFVERNGITLGSTMEFVR